MCSSDLMRSQLEAMNLPAEIRLQATGSADEPVGASAVLTTSGTMSMHCALAGIPGAVTYKTDPLTYWLGRMIVTVEYIGIANLLLKRAMYRELIQGEASADNLAAELQGALTDKDRVAQIQSDAEELRSLLSSSADLTTATWMANQLRA